jgi:hypothetical protein
MPSLKKWLWFAGSSARSYSELALAARRDTGLVRRLRQLSARPVILGGCGRSGTTLLLAVLSCHRRIYAIPNETMAFCPDAYASHPDTTLPFRLDWIYRELLTGDVPESCVRWCEKTPKNVTAFGPILRRYGNRARLIHIVRDGRAVVASRHPTRPGAYHVRPERWLADVTMGMRYERHPCVLTLRYEDLIRDYEATTRRICSFIDEEWTPEFSDFPRSARVKSHLAWSNELQRLSAASLDRWRDTEHAAAVGELCALPEARRLLERLGYAD